MRLKPIGNRILVRKDLPLRTTSTGLHLVETVEKPTSRGVVIGVGQGQVNQRNEGGTHIPLEVKEGDYIVFSRYGGTEIEPATESEGALLSLTESDVIAIDLDGVPSAT